MPATVQSQTYMKNALTFNVVYDTVPLHSLLFGCICCYDPLMCWTLHDPFELSGLCVVCVCACDLSKRIWSF